MAIMSRGNLNSSSLKVVDGVPASLEVGLTVQLYVSVQTNSALKLTVLLEGGGREGGREGEREITYVGA